VSFTPESIRSGSVYYSYATKKMDMAERETISVFYKDPGGTVFHTFRPMPAAST